MKAISILSILIISFSCRNEIKNSSNKNQYSFKGFAKNEIILNSEIERLTPVYIPQELVNDISIKFTKDNNFTDKERTEYSEIYYDFEMFNDYLKIFNGNVLYQDNIDFFTVRLTVLPALKHPIQLSFTEKNNQTNLEFKKLSATHGYEQLELREVQEVNNYKINLYTELKNSLIKQDYTTKEYKLPPNFATDGNHYIIEISDSNTYGLKILGTNVVEQNKEITNLIDSIVAQLNTTN